MSKPNRPRVRIYVWRRPDGYWCWLYVDREPDGTGELPLLSHKAFVSREEARPRAVDASPTSSASRSRSWLARPVAAAAIGGQWLIPFQQRPGWFSRCASTVATVPGIGVAPVSSSTVSSEICRAA